MRKGPLLALGMCAAAFLGQVSLTFAGPAQSSGAQAQTPGQQSAAQQSPQTAKPTSSLKTQSAPPSQQTGKQPSGQKAQAALPNQQTDRPPSAQKAQSATPSPQTGKQASAKLQAGAPSPQAGKQASAQNPQATQPSQQVAKTASSLKAQAAQSNPQTTQASGPKAQAARPPVIPPGYRLLTLNEGRAIVQGMSWADDEEGLSPDCSHLVHKLYEQAGHPYPYASSLDLYRGTGPFVRVRYAHPGDLVVWRGHAGIVVNPREHSFFSTTSSGARAENYRSAYWRARGYPHFFRYLTKSPPKATNGGTAEAANHQPQH